ncbi:MAG TPA: nitroreductase family protein [Symbiobacteriaceae bacterium]|nr:nitroreductase family protein [Symbiobacteriaceae bacterium]
MMDVLEAITSRHSVRAFLPDPVPEETLMQLLDAAHQAPSSMNLQPWEFIVVTSQEAKDALSECVTAGNVNVVKNGGATFVCLGSMRQQDALADRLEKQWITPDATPERIERVQRNLLRLREDKEFRREHVLTNTYIAVAQLVLAAERFGLGSLWMGGFFEEKVKAAMGIPDDYIVASLITVGRPAPEAALQPRKRRPLSEIYSFNRFER